MDAEGDVVCLADEDGVGAGNGGSGSVDGDAISFDEGALLGTWFEIQVVCLFVRVLCACSFQGLPTSANVTFVA